MTYHRPFETELARRIQQRLPFIQAVIGPRQVGKTTGVLNLEEVLKQPYLYCSADLPAPPGYDWIREQWVLARARANTGNGVLVLDEVQKIPGWSEVVKALFDEERRRSNPLQVLILGSASWQLQAGLTETLLGRYEVLRAPHWDLTESKAAFGWDLTTFLKYGGYPAAATLIDEPTRWQRFIRDSIIEPMISRDLFSMREISKPALFRQTLQLALTYPAQEISLQKLLGQLQDHGNAATIRGYLDLLNAGSVIASLHKFSTRALTVKSSSPKLVPLCPALVHATTPPTRIDTDPVWRGRVFEAAIGAKLITGCDGAEIRYWRDGDFEVDYVVEQVSELLAIEVKSARVRRSDGLARFRSKFPHAKTLTLNQELGAQLLASPEPLNFLRSLV